MDKTTTPPQPVTDDLFTQGSSTEHATAQPAPAEIPGPQSDAGTPQHAERTPAPTATPPPNAAPATRSTWELVWMVLLVMSLSLASAAAGVLLSAQLFPPPPPVKIGMISLTRLTRAITDAEPSTSASFATRFDSAAKQLVESEPGLVLFVKEAVIDTGQIADYTNVMLPLFTSKSPTPTVPPPATEPPATAPPTK